MKFEFDMKGVEEFTRTLQQLPEPIRRNVVTVALRAGGRLLVSEVKARAPVGTGALKKSVRMSKIKRYANDFSVFVEPKVWYARLIEFNFTRRGKTYPAKPFIRPAFDATKGLVNQAFMRKATEQLPKVLERYKTR
jgi:HK97 gp10 family phage protein